MKKLAFFVAVLVGLSASPVVRKPEEEQQAIVMKDDNSDRKNNTSIIIHHINKFVFYFYAITKEGRKDIISWDRISKLIGLHNSNIEDRANEKKLNNYLGKNKLNWIHLEYDYNGKDESCSSKLLHVKK